MCHSKPETETFLSGGGSPYSKKSRFSEFFVEVAHCARATACFPVTLSSRVADGLSVLLCDRLIDKSRISILC